MAGGSSIPAAVERARGGLEPRDLGGRELGVLDGLEMGPQPGQADARRDAVDEPGGGDELGSAKAAPTETRLDLELDGEGSPGIELGRRAHELRKTGRRRRQ